jgi:hypothetical protein
MHKVILETPRKRRDEDFFLGIHAEEGRESAEEDTCVCSDGRFRVDLHLGEETKEVVVEQSIRELQDVWSG